MLLLRCAHPHDEGPGVGERLRAPPCSVAWMCIRRCFLIFFIRRMVQSWPTSAQYTSLLLPSLGTTPLRDRQRDRTATRDDPPGSRQHAGDKGSHRVAPAAPQPSCHDVPSKIACVITLPLTRLLPTGQPWGSAGWHGAAAGERVANRRRRAEAGPSHPPANTSVQRVVSENRKPLLKL